MICDLVFKIQEWSNVMHVVWDWPHVVEEFGINGPAFVFVVDVCSDDPRPSFFDGFLEQEMFTANAYETQTLVPNSAVVSGLRRATEPAFVAPASCRSSRERRGTGRAERRTSRHYASAFARLRWSIRKFTRPTARKLVAAS